MSLCGGCLYVPCRCEKDKKDDIIQARKSIPQEIADLQDRVAELEAAQNGELTPYEITMLWNAHIITKEEARKLLPFKLPDTKSL